MHIANTICLLIVSWRRDIQSWTIGVMKVVSRALDRSCRMAIDYRLFRVHCTVLVPVSLSNRRPIQFPCTIHKLPFHLYKWDMLKMTTPMSTVVRYPSDHAEPQSPTVPSHDRIGTCTVLDLDSRDRVDCRTFPDVPPHILPQLPSHPTTFPNANVPFRYQRWTERNDC